MNSQYSYNNLNCNCNFNFFRSWEEIPYAGECKPPIGEEPLASYWPLCFLKRNDDDLFTDSFGNIIPLDIKEPNISFDFEGELNFLYYTLNNLTCRQAKIAEYWSDGPPSKQFMPIADILIDTYGVSACRANRIYYILNGALNDSCIICWYLKYKWNIIRPNQYDRSFASLICTPKHPSYPSGHSTFAACMAEILSYFFPTEKEKLDFLAEQCSYSRVYAGVHYRFDCDEGLKLGRSIAKAILKEVKYQSYLNRVQVDIPYVIFKDADIIPHTLEQYIPFDRDSKCSSLTLN